jgi:hypothetical protein
MTITLHPDVTATTTETGMVLLDERHGRYWQLNDTGALVLQALLDGATPELAARRLAARFPDVTAEQAARDVAALVKELSRTKLVSRG